MADNGTIRVDRLLNTKTSQVALDRRVSVVEGISKDAHLIRSVRDLRRFKRVVLIGEPGMGKSAVLRQEAQDTHCLLYTSPSPRDS